MTEAITKLVINCETGEQNLVPLTAEELAQREADDVAWAAEKAAREAAAQAAAEAKASGIAKLLALGLTEDEANALVK
jgi:hypothetical protein